MGWTDVEPIVRIAPRCKASIACLKGNIVKLTISLSSTFLGELGSPTHADARHLEQRRADGRAQYAKNPVPYKARARAWGRAHPEYLKFMVARRRATILHAMPPWLTPEQLEEMRAIYARAPAGHDVDHIIPLRGKTVCGLHVPWNLQYLPTAANRAKGNRHG